MLRIALTTFSDEAAARSCARDMVSAGHVACATLLPGCLSVYRWQGALEESPEVAVLFKVVPEKFEAFQQTLLAAHPYDTPELLAWDSTSVNPAYEAWARNEPEIAGG